MRTPEEKQRAARYVLNELNTRHWDGRRLALEAKIDEGTVRTFLRGNTYPQRPSRTAIEETLGLPVGSIEGAAMGLLSVGLDDEGVHSDAVEAAIYRSKLSRANQLKLAGIYYEMLETQDREVRGA